MRIRLYSDLHLEFAAWTPSEVEDHSDVVILAGDIHAGLRGVNWAKQHFADTPVLYVPGNHEYYGHALPYLTDKLRAATQGTQVHILDRGAATVNGVTFLGLTLWTDFKLLGDATAAMARAQISMADYRRIRHSTGPNDRFRRLKPVDTLREYSRGIAWLRDQLADAEGPVCVISHHAPHSGSIAPQYTGNSLNPAFVSHVPTDILLHPKVHGWMHGHTHTAFDYTVQPADSDAASGLTPTRVLCNPRGYGRFERIEGYRPDGRFDLEPYP